MENEALKAFSLLRCAYGWSGVAPADVQERLDRIARSVACPDCAARQMAVLLHESGIQFQARRDGKPNARSVWRDQVGCHGSRLN